MGISLKVYSGKKKMNLNLFRRNDLMSHKTKMEQGSHTIHARLSGRPFLCILPTI